MAACDFCSKHGYEVEGLVFSRLGHKVCKDCLLVCGEILEGEREPKPIPSKYEVAAPTDILRSLLTGDHARLVKLDVPQCAASVQPEVTSDDEFPYCGVVPEAALSLMNRMTFDCFAPGRLNINLIGGTAGGRCSSTISRLSHRTGWNSSTQPRGWSSEPWMHAW